MVEKARNVEQGSASSGSFGYVSRIKPRQTPLRMTGYIYKELLRQDTRAK
jgi:hypothetical protein